jgi:histidinol-phosphatase (PHP family)
MFDYHLHTPYCRHASGSLDEYAARARERALEEICFTPHLPLPDFPRGGPDLRMDLADLDGYVAAVHDLRARWPDLTILCGVEADYYEGYERYLDDVLSRYPFDLVLLSVHFVRAWPGENWLFDFHFPVKSMVQVYSEYFAEIGKAVRTRLFDCLAHLDVIKQPGHPVMQNNRDDIEEILDLCLDFGLTVEINTSGLRKGAGEIYPARDILELAVRRKLPLITSSDAHEPDSVAYAFPEVSSLLRSLPGCRLARYRQRTSTIVSVQDWGSHAAAQR